MAKIATLSDSFTTKDTAKWNWTASASIVNGQLNLPNRVDYGSSVTSVAAYDLTNSSIFMQLVSIAPAGLGSTEVSLQLYVNSTTKTQICVGDNGTILAQQTTNGTSWTTIASTTYNAATMKYLRISHNGSQVIYSYSADAQNWTQLGAWTPTFAITAMQVVIISGFWNSSEATTYTSTVDNVNIGTIAVDMASATLAENASATALTVNVPAGTSAGDLLVLATTIGGGTIAASLSGWTTIATTTAGSNAAGGLYYRVATASEPASYTLSGLTSAANKVSASITRVLNVDSVSPLDSTAATVSGTGNITAPTVAVNKPGSVIFYLPIIDSATTSDWSMPSGVTEIKDSTGTGKRLVTAYETQAATGTSTARTFTQTGTTGLSAAAITVAFRAASVAGTLAFVNSVRTANSGVTDASIVVPSGVTTSHLGILTVEAANQGLAAMAVPTGWTMRGKNPGTGGSTATLYVFTRLGGVKAGDTVTATLPSNTGATTTAAWYDTGGRDIALVSSVYDTASADVTTVTFPAPGHVGYRDVILVAANRTTNANTLSTPTGVTMDANGQEATWFGGAFFGHAANVASQVYTGTWAPSAATSHNVNAMQFVLAAVSNPKFTALSDDFTTKDLAKWTWSGTEPSVVSGQLQIACTANYGYIKTAVPYDLTGSSLYCQLIQRPAAGNGTTETLLTLTPDVGNTNGLRFDVQGANLAFVRNVGGVSTTIATIAFSATNHAWWRLRESGGTVFWDTSPDAVTWTQQASWVPTFAVTALYASLSSGYYGTETSPAPAIFDNVNTAPPANPKLFMAAVAPSAVYLGSTQITAAYLGSTKVWP